MKNILRILTSILLAAVSATAAAQLYIIDDIFADSAQVYSPAWNKEHTCEIVGEPAFKLPMGETVTVTRTLTGNKHDAVIVVDGKEYAMYGSQLLFSDENPEGSEDIFGNTRERTNHSTMGKFFATMTPYWIIAILFVAAMIFTWLGFKSSLIRRLSLPVVPACLLVASLLEVWAYSVLGKSAFWWCDPDRYGFFGALFRVIPFIAFVAFQLYSIKWYMRLITEDADNGLSVKPMLISIGICVPLSLAVLFISVGCFDIKSPWQEIIFIGTFLISLSIGIVISTRRNIKELGKRNGIAFSLFGLAWAVGAIVAIWGLIMVVFQLIIQILIVCAAVFAMAMMGGRRYKDSWGNVYEEDGFGNIRKIN